MKKHDLAASELLELANQHALSAEVLLQQNAEIKTQHHTTMDVLVPITTMFYTAFELTFKACLMQEQRALKQYKPLMELVELNTHLGLSKQEIELLRLLSRQQAFHKGFDFMLWDNRQQFHVFCAQLMHLYQRVQELIPIELHQDYLF